MAELIKGNQSLEWGTAEGGGTGFVQSAKAKLGGEKLELKDEAGETVAVVYFDEKNECEFEALAQSGVTLPGRGDTISIGGVSNCLVDEVEEMWDNKNVKKFSVRATKYANF